MDSIHHDDPERFRDIYNSLLNTQSTDKADRYFILKDFRSYAEAQKRVEEAYKDQEGWLRRQCLTLLMLVNLHLTEQFRNM